MELGLTSRNISMNTVTVEFLAEIVHALQAHLVGAKQKIDSHQKELGMAAQRVQSLER